MKHIVEEYGNAIVAAIFGIAVIGIFTGLFVYVTSF